MAKNSIEDFRRRIKEIRVLRNKTQSEMAEELHMSRSCLTNYECGIRTPSLESTYEMANNLDVDIGFLMGSNALPEDIEEFSLNTKKLNKYLNKKSQLNLSSLSIFYKVIMVELFKFFSAKDRYDKIIEEKENRNKLNEGCS